MSDFVREATDENFQNEVLGSDQPVLVDFWAAWCGPCRMIAPTIEAVAEKYQGKAKVMKLNVDENPNTPMQFGIRGIPTLILYKGGEVAETIVGVPGNAQATLSNLLDKHVA
ncbi:MAG: thioredoxin [Acidobacteria bacterium]|nr:thioredoxin [Acidobacteriota bacterium]